MCHGLLAPPLACRKSESRRVRAGAPDPLALAVEDNSPNEPERECPRNEGDLTRVRCVTPSRKLARFTADGRLDAPYVDDCREADRELPPWF